MTFRKKVLVAIPSLVICVVVFVLGCLMKMHIELYKNGTNGYGADISEYLKPGEIVVSLFGIIFVFTVICGTLAYVVRNWRNICRNEEKNRMVRNQLKEIKLSVGKLQDAYASSEKTYKAKNRFLNRMSHDLRTPMNAIMGYSALMERSSHDPEKVIHYAQRIFVAGQTLLELINDALDMSCIESGNLKLVEHEFSLKSAFEEVITAVKPQMESKKQSFGFYFTNGTDKDLIAGDKQRFCQVLRNLLSNAVKYTAEGGSVDLKVDVVEIGANRIQITYLVQDNGCGMSEEFAKRLFQPFEREENEMNTSIPGTGLGMCIAKSFVDLMRGNIAVESRLGEGTSVTVRLPLKPVIKCSKEFHLALTDSNELQGMNFLAAEDNESNAEILKEVLSAMGAGCTLTDNGQAVVEAFEESDPGMYDAILMDIQMPVMNGYQATNKIRSSSHPDGDKIAIIAMTADAFEEDVQKAFVSGMNAHVAKPLNIQSFIETIKTLGLN